MDYLPKYRRKKQVTVSEIPTGRNSKKIATIEENSVSDDANAIARNSDLVGSNPDRGRSNTTQNQLCPVVFIERTTTPIGSNLVPDKSNSVEDRLINPQNNSKVSMNSPPESSSSESFENVSLLERLKSVFVKPSTSGKMTRSSRRTRSMNFTKDGISETSCIEGTPLPISRSFLWKSQIKQNTFATNLLFNESEKSNEANVSETTDESVESFGTKKRPLKRSKEIGR